MNIVLGYLALAAIVAGIMFTALAQRHPVHIIGLGLMAMGFALGINLRIEAPSFTFLCIGAIVTGFGGAWFDRRKKK